MGRNLLRHGFALTVDDLDADRVAALVADGAVAASPGPVEEAVVMLSLPAPQHVAAVCLGAVAMALGILFRSFNVSFLVGWAFNIAASANLPALVMLLFWPRTTRQGIIAAVTVGMLSKIGRAHV